MRTRLVIPAAILLAAAYVKGRQDGVFVAPASPTPEPAPKPSAEDLLRAQAEAADAWELGLAEAEVAATATAYAPELVEVDEPEFVEPDVHWDEPEVPVDEPVVELDEPVLHLDGPVVHTDKPEAIDPFLALSEWAAPAADGFSASARVEAATAAVPTATERPVVHQDPAELSEWWAVPASPAAVVEETGRFALGGWAAQAGHPVFAGVTFRARRDGEAIDPARVRLVVEAAQNAAGTGPVVLADAGFAPDAEGFAIVLAAAAPGAFAVSGRYELLAAPL